MPVSAVKLLTAESSIPEENGGPHDRTMILSGFSGVPEGSVVPGVAGPPGPAHAASSPDSTAAVRSAATPRPLLRETLIRFPFSTAQRLPFPGADASPLRRTRSSQAPLLGHMVDHRPNTIDQSTVGMGRSRGGAVDPRSGSARLRNPPLRWGRRAMRVGGRRPNARPADPKAPDGRQRSSRRLVPRPARAAATALVGRPGLGRAHL